jgi:hypothetical protein
MRDREHRVQGGIYIAVGAKWHLPAPELLLLCAMRVAFGPKRVKALSSLPPSFLLPFNLVRLSRPPGLVPGLVPGLFQAPSNPSTYCPYPGIWAASILACAVTRISVGMPSAYVESSWV